MTPTVSVLMPAYNAAPFIDAAIDSVLAQTFEDWELIVVDDASGDASAAKAESYAACDPRIRVIRRDSQSGGPFVPRMTAARHARGRFVVGMDADDVIEPEFLAKLVRRQRETGAQVVLHQLWDYHGDYETASLFRPAAGFDLGRIFTGEEAYLMMLDWWARPGNGLMARDVYLAADEMPDWLKGNPFADELPALLPFLDCDTIALAPARYYYRVNDTSVTKRVSLSRYMVMDSDMWVRRQLQERYETGSEMLRMAEAHFYTDMLNRMLSLTPCCGLSRRDRRRIDEMMERARAAMDWELVGRTYRGPMLRVMRMGYLPAKLILGLYGSLRRK